MVAKTADHQPTGESWQELQLVRQPSALEACDVSELVVVAETVAVGPVGVVQ